MNRVKKGLRRFGTYRLLVQFLSFLLFSSIVFNLGALPILLPVLWTWGIEPNTLGDAFTAIQLFLAQGIFPWLAVASFLITGILVGKSLCGWICPFGLIQDLIDLVKSSKMIISPRTRHNLVYMKYAILGVTLFISSTFSIAQLTGNRQRYESALGVFAEAPFTAISPAETLFATMPRMIHDFRVALIETPVLEALSAIGNLPPLFWIQLFIVVAVLVFVLYVPRGWCKYFCPHGAVMAIMNRISFLGLRRDPIKCAKGECRLCVQACPMNVRILDLPWQKFSDSECIYCMKCADACSDGAIRPTFP